MIAALATVGVVLAFIGGAAAGAVYHWATRHRDLMRTDLDERTHPYT